MRTPAVLQGIGPTNITGRITIEVMKQPRRLDRDDDAGRAEVMDILWVIGTSLRRGLHLQRGGWPGAGDCPGERAASRRLGLRVAEPSALRQSEHTIRPGPRLWAWVSGASRP